MFTTERIDRELEENRQQYENCKKNHAIIKTKAIETARLVEDVLDKAKIVRRSDFTGGQAFFNEWLGSHSAGPR